MEFRVILKRVGAKKPNYDRANLTQCCGTPYSCVFALLFYLHVILFQFFSFHLNDVQFSPNAAIMFQQNFRGLLAAYSMSQVMNAFYVMIGVKIFLLLPIWKGFLIITSKNLSVELCIQRSLILGLLFS